MADKVPEILRNYAGSIMQLLHSGIDDARDCAVAAFAYLPPNTHRNGASHRVTEVIDMAYPTQTSARHGAFHFNPAVIFEAALERFTTYLRYRRTLIELQTLSDRQLDDLGLNRSMLHGTAREAVEQTR